MLIRQAQPADFRAYVNGDFSPEWCAVDPIGLVAEDAGRIVGVAIVSRDAKGRYWLWYNARAPLLPITIHRTAVRYLDGLKDCGVRIIRAFCDEKAETAERWLKRLGFAPLEITRHPSGVEKMAWARILN